MEPVSFPEGATIDLCKMKYHQFTLNRVYWGYMQYIVTVWLYRLSVKAYKQVCYGIIYDRRARAISHTCFNL